jgi:predicted ATP-dependent serine protease
MEGDGHYYCQECGRSFNPAAGSASYSRCSSCNSSYESDKAALEQRREEERERIRREREQEDENDLRERRR